MNHIIAYNLPIEQNYSNPGEGGLLIELFKY